jgi:hypothetical protein
MPTPQSGIGGISSVRSLMERAGKTAQVGLVHPALILTGNGEALPRGSGDKIRWLQNVGTVSVKYLISSSQDCTENLFHGVLMGGAAQDDGSGGVLDVSSEATRVSIFSTSGAHRVAVVRVSNPEGAL